MFGIPELDSAMSFVFLKIRCIKRVNSLVNEVVSPSRRRKMVEVYDDISDTLCQVADMANFIRLYHQSAKYRHAADEAYLAMHGLVDKYV